MDRTTERILEYLNDEIGKCDAKIKEMKEKKNLLRLRIAHGERYHFVRTLNVVKQIIQEEQNK